MNNQQQPNANVPSHSSAAESFAEFSSADDDEDNNATPGDYTDQGQIPNAGTIPALVENLPPDFDFHYLDKKVDHFRKNTGDQMSLLGEQVSLLQQQMSLLGQQMDHLQNHHLTGMICAFDLANVGWDNSTDFCGPNLAFHELHNSNFIGAIKTKSDVQKWTNFRNTAKFELPTECQITQCRRLLHIQMKYKEINSSKVGESKEGSFCIGVASGNFPWATNDGNVHVGKYVGSCAIDNKGHLHKSGIGHPSYCQPFGNNDLIGCGMVLSLARQPPIVFFTKNGDIFGNPITLDLVENANAAQQQSFWLTVSMRTNGDGVILGDLSAGMKLQLLVKKFECYEIAKIVDMPSFYQQNILWSQSHKGNMWNKLTTEATISTTNPCIVAHNGGSVQNVFGIHAYPLNKIDNFHVRIIYYYEVKVVTSAENYQLRVGLTPSQSIDAGKSVGDCANTYAICSNYATFPHYYIAGTKKDFQWPPGTAKPELNEATHFGCGLLIGTDEKVSVFFTANGILMGSQISLTLTADQLHPAVSIYNVTVEANFGNDLAKPFMYNDECLRLHFY